MRDAFAGAARECRLQSPEFIGRQILARLADPFRVQRAETSCLHHASDSAERLRRASRPCGVLRAWRIAEVTIEESFQKGGGLEWRPPGQSQQCLEYISHDGAGTRE